MVNDMLCSMTGFGRSEVSVGERKVTVEIKSVNHRFLEAGIKLPKKLNYLDGDIRRILKSKIERGKVDVFITYENTGEVNVCLKYNSELAAEYYNIFKKMSDEEKDEYIKQNPAYGRIICRCETVSEGEIIDALRRNPKATDIDGVKRRTRSGMGRCQGGFCMPYVMRLIEKETGKPMTEITKKGGKSNTVTGRL